LGYGSEEQTERPGPGCTRLSRSDNEPSNSRDVAHNEVMRAWLAHADVHRIAVFADARDEGLAKAYIKHYGFRLSVR